MANIYLHKYFFGLISVMMLCVLYVIFWDKWNPVQLIANTDKLNYMRPLSPYIHVFTGTSKPMIKDKMPPEERSSTTKTLFIMNNFKGGTGNHIFEFASLCGIARHNNMTPVLRKGDILRQVFQIPENIPTGIPENLETVHFRERKYGCYDNRTLLLHTKQTSVKLDGYLCSWKYFWKFSSEIRQQFRFRDEYKYRRLIDDFLIKEAPSTSVDTTKSNITYIGVQVRHGKSMTNDIARNRGYVVAPPSYFTKAMAYFESRYKNVVFVVVSDDMPWSKQNVQHPRVLYSPFSKDHVLELALLVSCNHTIMSVGTYSWWAAWLAGGDAVYYRDWPKKDSFLWGRTCHEDYFWPNWIGLSG